MTQAAYVVCKGWYSDRSIHRVYLDKEKAEEFVTLHNKRMADDYDQFDIEEHEIADEWPIEQDARDGKVPGFVAWRSPDGFLSMSPGQINVRAWGWDDGDPVMEVHTEKGSQGEYPVINIPFPDAEDDPKNAFAIAEKAFDFWERTKT